MCAEIEEFFVTTSLFMTLVLWYGKQKQNSLTNQNIGEKISNVYLVENRLLEQHILPNNVNHVMKYLVMPTN